MLTTHFCLSLTQLVMLTSGFVQLCKRPRITGRLISTNLSGSTTWVGKSSCLNDVYTCQKRSISFDRKNIIKLHSIAETGDTASGHLKAILDGNKRWVAEQTATDPKFFDKLAKPQRPKFLYFGCSDSRVPANQILGLG